MNIHIFKTDLSTLPRINALAAAFERHPHVVDWSVDREDIDHVLRIRTEANLTEHDWITIVRSLGVMCEPLPDFIPA